MKRVGIITYHHVPNYGAAMQAWSLQMRLQHLGYDAFIVDYRPSHLTTGGGFIFPRDRWTLRANLVKGYMKLNAAKQKLKGSDEKLRRFERFHRDFLNIGAMRYTTNKSLRKNPPEADVYVCGSDQIWNASEQIGIDSSYFLDFAPQGVGRVAYAPSFARPFVHERFAAATAALIQKMDALSIREKSGVELIDKLCGREAEWVPDPTLLIEDNFPDAALPQSRAEEYIFSYTLRSRDVVAAIESNLADELGLELLSPKNLSEKGMPEAGPLEWLGYIKSSRFMITNSYHGTLFSIIFKRPFVFVALTGAKAGFNERAFSLLNGLGLEARIVKECDRNQLSQLIHDPIDWESVHEKIREWRLSADQYLAKSIG